MKVLALFLMLSSAAFADSLSWISGTVTASNTSPWPYYDKAEQGNVRDIRPMALDHKPVLGAAAPGTFSLADGCTITLTGTGASDFKMSVVSVSKASAAVFTVVAHGMKSYDYVSIDGATGDWAAMNGLHNVTPLTADTFSIAVDSSAFSGTFSTTDVVKYNLPVVALVDSVDGANTGHLFFYVLKIVGNVITSSTQCGLSGLGLSAATGVPVYHCDAGCSSQVIDPTLGKVFDNGWWAQASGWNFYDVGHAMRLYAMRTGNATDMDKAREWADTYWTWALASGATYLGDPMYAILMSQFERALDGKPERLPALKSMIERRWAGADPLASSMTDGNFDNRESGYLLQWFPLGAKADTDPTRHAWYCSQIESNFTTLLTYQQPEGYWSEKNPGYYYRPPGVSPWRNFAMGSALAHAYDVLNDTTSAGCNDTTLAANVLTALSKMAEFTYTYGRTPDRGFYYDVQYENNGHEAVGHVGTVSATLGSDVITGSGTAFLTDAAVGKYITVIDYPNYTYKIASIESDTSLHITTSFSDSGAGIVPLHNAVNVSWALSQPAVTACGVNSLATGCLPVDRPRDYLIDSIWMMGWLYKTTGLSKWKVYGDELASAAYGGEAGGPGASYPSAPGACGGPACDGGHTVAMAFAITGCASDPTLPCEPDSNNTPAGTGYTNAAATLGKYFGQTSGQGAFDNYLAWRLTSSACGDLAFSPNSASVSAAGGSGTFNATMTDQTCDRAISTSSSVTCTAHCTGLGDVTGIGWSIAANTGLARTGTLSAAGVNFTITQANGCAFSISPTSHSYVVAGAAQSVVITASDSACPWTASYPDGWLSGLTSGTGSGTITVTATANTSSSRSSTVTIAGQSFSVTQDGAIFTDPTIRLHNGSRVRGGAHVQ